MRPEQLREALRREPFRPFVVQTAGGREHAVRDPEMALLVPSGRTLVVVDPDEVATVVDVALIESIRDDNGMSKNGAG